MNEKQIDVEYGDPTSRPFWEAAVRKRFVIQKCERCGRHQFYPRTFCLHCESDQIEWVEAGGLGTVYSMTTVERPLLPDMEVPYVVAIVQLDEGPRLLTNVLGNSCKIGDRVRVTWRERPNAPPVPVFSREVT